MSGFPSTGTELLSISTEIKISLKHKTFIFKMIRFAQDFYFAKLDGWTTFVMEMCLVHFTETTNGRSH
jgi:hypothetical protein